MSDAGERCPRCGLAVPPGRFAACPVCMLDVEPLELLGQSVELEEEIGRGGMGMVHRGRHVRLDRPVAVKFLAQSVAADPDFVRRFEREARTLARLSHPGIVAVHDFGLDGDRLYLVMELVEGPPLAGLIPLPAERALPLFLQLCDALAYAHENGVIHRDIKPENILLDGTSRTKLTDFGIARSTRAENRGWTVTSPDVLVGTLPYMAPEALVDTPPAPSMDIYALGVVMYQTLMGRLPTGDFDPAPGPFDRIIRRALAPDPARRYANVRELASDLGTILTTNATPAPPAPPAAAHDESDEKMWRDAVALLLACSTAVCLWAALQCLTPRVLPAAEVSPLVMVASSTRPDGRILTLARFETGPVLAAGVAIALSMVAFNMLWRHWRRSGLLLPVPASPVPEARRVLILGITSPTVYAIHRALDHFGHTVISAYVPILGGCVLLSLVYMAWISILECWRRARSLAREPLIWLGIACGIVPPVCEFIKYVQSFR